MLRFNWKNNQHSENQELRTHISKDFAHPTIPDKRVLIQSAGLLHYNDGKSFKDLTDLPFPERKLIALSKDKHFVMDLPEWSKAKLSDNDSVLQLFDKLDQPIYIFKGPFVITKGEKPYQVVTIDNKQLKRETDNRKEKVGLDEQIILKKNTVDQCKFVVEKNQLYIKLPSVLKNKYPLQMYDDADTSSTNNKDSFIKSADDANNNYGSLEYIMAERRTDAVRKIRSLIHFTLSSGGGTVSDVKLYLNLYNVGPGGVMGLDIHQLTQTGWTEAGVTWNKYDGSTDWTAAGGDYNATVIDSYAWNGSTTGYIEWVVMGAGASNPLTLTWEDELHLLLKDDTEINAGNGGASYFRSKEYASNKPYLEITYSGVSTSPSLSPSASISPSTSPSISPSVSPSISPSASISPSISPSISLSISPSISPSLSPSVSPSLSYELYHEHHLTIDDVKPHIKLSIKRF